MEQEQVTELVQLVHELAHAAAHRWPSTPDCVADVPVWVGTTLGSAAIETRYCRYCGRTHSDWQFIPHRKMCPVQRAQKYVGK